MIASFTKYLTFLPGLWKHRRLGFVTALLIGLIGATVVMLLPSRYEASARAYVDTQTILRPLMEGMAVQPDVTQQLSMMSRALLSRANLQEVATVAGLLDGTQTEVATESLLSALSKKIQFEPAGRENFFSLKYRHPEPEVALSVVTSLLDIFFNSARSNQERDTRQALAFLDEQIKLYEVKLVAAENALKEFKINNLEVMPNLQQDYFAQTAEVQQKLDQAQLEYQQTLNARAALRSQLEGVPQSFSSADPRAGPGAMSETEKDLKVALANTDAQVASLRARVADAQRRLQSVRTLAKTVPEVEAQYKQLNRDYEVNKTNYEQLVSRRESALLSGNLDATSGAGDFRVVDPPKVSTAPVWPNRPLLLILVCFGSLAAGVFAALVRSQSAPAFFDVYSLRAATDVPVFGSVSLVREGAVSVMSGLGSLSFWLLILAYVGAFAVAIVLTMLTQAKREPAEPTLSTSPALMERFMQSEKISDKTLLPGNDPAAKADTGSTPSTQNRAL